MCVWYSAIHFVTFRFPSSQRVAGKKDLTKNISETFSSLKKMVLFLPPINLRISPSFFFFFSLFWHVEELVANYREQLLSTFLVRCIVSSNIKEPFWYGICRLEALRCVGWGVNTEGDVMKKWQDTIETYFFSVSVRRYLHFLCYSVWW